MDTTVTYDELLEGLNFPWIDVLVGNTRAEKYRLALRAVVELHKNVDGACWECQDDIYHEYPCPTIRAIEKELL